MRQSFVALFLCGLGLFGSAFAQTDPSPPAATAPAPPAPAAFPNLPPGIGPQAPPNFGPPNVGAPPMPPMPTMPSDPGRARGPAAPLPPPAPPPSASASLISFLDSTAPYVQAFDLVLMLIAGVFCWRARHAPGLTILAISCFASAVILLGFFLFGIFHGQGAFPQATYILARLLAPFELLLFVVGLILVARAHRPK